MLEIKRYVNHVLVHHTVDGASVIEKAENAAGAASRLAKAIVKRERVLVSPEEQQRRMAICAGSESIQKCDFYTGKTCKKCGCHIRFKAKLQTEHCPIGKW